MDDLIGAVDKNHEYNFKRIMFQAINGHLSLVHTNFAPESVVPDTYRWAGLGENNTVEHWKNKTLKVMCVTKNNFEKVRLVQQKVDVSNWKPKNCSEPQNQAGVKLNKYCGYVYDAVWLYAKSLDFTS